MKNSYLYIRLPLILVVFCWFLASSKSFSQIFYNGGADIGIDPGTILYVGGGIKNDVGGFIKNDGDIYLTENWTNEEPGGLAPTSGKVILYGSTLQNIQGSQPTTFNNLDCEFGSTKKLQVNTIVGGTSGIFALDSCPFDLNSYTCTITNSSSSAITRSTGYIISETEPTPGYGRVQWDIGNLNSTYTIPFGSGSVADADIPFIYDVTAAGTITAGDTGNISVATYPTNDAASPNNRPLPTGVSNLNDADGNESAPDCVDRFWIVDINNYSTNPTADITFTYRDSEWNGGTNIITEDSLEAWKWNGSQWQNPTVGIADVNGNTVTAPSINYAGPWTLTMKKGPVLPVECGDYKVPNAFSPNNDGHNDLFVLHGWDKCVSNFSLVIFDRWGEKVYETSNPANSWDGKYKGKTLDPAVFVYYIDAKSNSGEKVNKKGNISLIR